ncbi:MAG: TlpA family protein disulfide reductase [bacterium]
MRMPLSGWIALAGILALTAFTHPGYSQNETKGPVLGHEAPLFSATTMDGKKLDLQKLRGKLVLIDFWATWCPPCRAEIPHLREVYEKYHKKGFEIVSINVNDKEAKVKEFQKTQKMTWIHIKDTEGKISEKYGVISIPAPFLIDHTGKLVAMDVDLRGPNLMKQVAGHIKNVPEIEEVKIPASEAE